MPVKTLVYRVADRALSQRIEEAIVKGLGVRTEDEEWLVAVFPTQTGIGWDLAVHGPRFRAFRTLSAREPEGLPVAIERVLAQVLADWLGRSA